MKESRQFEKEDSLKPKVVVILFLLIFLFLGFIESKRAVFWATNRKLQRANIFEDIVLFYGQKSEEAKKVIPFPLSPEKELGFSEEIGEIDLIFEEPKLDENNFDQASENEEVEQEEEPPEAEDQEQKQGTEQEAEQEIEEKIESIKEPVFIGPKNDGKGYSFLVVGDSFMAVYGGVGDVVERELLSYKGTNVLRLGKVSSGLSRYDYFNWQKKAEELSAANFFDAVIIMIGSNDGQAIIAPDGKVVCYWGSNNWNNEYAKRVSAFLDIFAEKEIAVFWIAMPPMKNAVLSKKMANQNGIYKKETEEQKNFYFIPIWDLFTVSNGQYTDYVKDENGRNILVRTSDGVHMQYAGGDIVVLQLIEVLKQVFPLEKK